jgi:WD40 repeat protein
MVDPTPLQLDAIANNESSLNSLARAIKFSQGQFSLVLVCCNYAALQKSMLQKLQEVLGENQYQIKELHLPQTIRTLYRTIQIQLGSLQPSALMVLGLEGVGVLDELLSATNNVRDEFRKRLPFPMVLWVNDEVLQKLLRLAPDFTSWAATPIKFEMTTDELLKFLTIETNSLFTTVLNPGASQELGRSMMHPNSILSKVREESYELHSAIAKLLESGVRLPRELEASLEFVFGLDEYISDDIAEALHFFHESLKYWQQSAQNQPEQNNRIKINDLLGSELEILNTDNHALLRQGVLLFYIGLCHSRLADQNQTENRRDWQEAKTYFQQCVNLFEEAKRPDLVAQFIGQLCEVLQHLQEWQELGIIAQKSLELHGKYGTQIQLACDYGFLANIALQESRWERASQYAQTSLLNLADAKEKNDEQQGLFPLLLAQIYQLVLTKAQRNLHEGKIALERLETASRELEKALEHSAHRFDAHRYIRHLQTLELLYFEQGRYPEAFKIKQKRRSVEQQYGFRAFIGAGRLQPQRQATNPAAVRSVAREIDASGRQQDIDRLLGRISRSDQKLTVIHGPSGVGKSSTITAGLVPTLQHRGAIGDQIVVPVVLQDYTEWVRRLGKSLDEGIAQLQSAVPREEIPANGAANSVPGILQKLSENAQKDWITVLIFDQFEEFFFGSPDESQKKEFAQFLRDCLKIPFVKIILSLRDDYLDRLSEFKDLADWEGIDTSIVDKNIQHELKNFSKEDAKKLIEHFIERSQFNLEPDLINALVEDLAAGLGEVRPIELQLVGAQLQDERITKLDQYQRFRTKKVIERYLNQVITDCGSANRIAAQRVLCLLVDENNHRPFKTRKELAAGLPELEQKDKLDLVLDILVRSGLVVLFPDVPADRYQLIHDYLIDLIVELKQQQSDLLEDYLLTELQQLIKKQEQNQAQVEQLNSELRQESGLQRQLSQLRNKVVQGQAEIERLNSELRQKKQLKNGDSQPPQGLDLLTELHELRKWEERSRVEIEQLRAQLEQQESRKREELSRIEIDRLYVELEQQKLEAAIAQQEEQRNNQIRRNIFLQRALIGSVTAILALIISSFTAVVQWRQAIISASLADSASSEALFAIDKHIDALKDGLKAGTKLKQAVWVDSQTEEKVRTALYQAVYSVVKERNRFDGHMAEVYSVSFSPNASLIASASADKTVKLWRPNGKLFKTLSGIHGHTNRVNSVSFSRDGQALASASADNTVKIWSSDGSYLNTLQGPEGHTDVVNSVSFSPDNSLIASASADKTVKIWKRDGTFLRTLSGHDAAVRSVAWSPDGNTLASTSNDKKVILWSRSGKLLTTLLEHKDIVLDVAWAADSQTLATASLDYTIKLWSRKGKRLKTFLGHSNGVTSVSFSPDSKTIASASTDKTVKIWTIEGEVLATLKGHSKFVNRVSFSPDGKTLASASKDTTIRLWRSEDLLPLNPKGHTKGVTTVNFSPEFGKVVASASLDGTVKLWDLQGKPFKTFFGHTDQVWGLTFSRDSQMLASASKDKNVKLWRRDGTLITTLKGHTDTVFGVSFSKDGKTIASASKDKTVRLWSINGQPLNILLGHKEAVNWVSYSPDGKTIASASDDSTVKLWNQDGNLLKTLRGHQRSVYGVAWSPDGTMLASASVDNTIKLWTPQGKLLNTITGDGDGFTSVSFSPDGKTLATASEEKLKLWSLDGKLLIALKGYSDGLTSFSFSPDGKTLASGSASGTVIMRKLKDIELNNLLKRGCSWLADYLNNNSKVTDSDRALCK